MKDMKIDFIVQVLEGLADAEAGRVITTNELLKQLKSWWKQISAQ